jgi:hypothetical protein
LGRKAACRAHHAVAVVQDAHEQLRPRALTAANHDVEGTDFDDDLIVDRQPFAGFAHAAETPRTLEGFGQPRLHDLWQAVAPLRALEELHRTGAGLDDDVLAVERLQRRRLGD